MVVLAVKALLSAVVEVEVVRLAIVPVATLDCLPMMPSLEAVAVETLVAMVGAVVAVLATLWAAPTLVMSTTPETLVLVALVASSWPS